MKSGFLMIMAATLCCVLSCKKSNDKPDNNNNNNTPTFSVTTISPLHGPGGTNITISGKGFSVNDTVKINGKPAVISSANDTALVVTIPSLVGSGTVAVTIGGNTVNGPYFTYDTVYVVSTYAGGNIGYHDGTGTNAMFNNPFGICSDPNGNLYVSELFNNRIRKIAPGAIVTTLAGSTPGYKNGKADTTQFNSPMGICRDGQGNLYINDFGNYAMRLLTTTGFVSTLAGGAHGYVDSTGTAAKFGYPAGMCMNAGGTFYIADAGNNIIRSMTGTGVVKTFVGKPYVQGSQDGTGQSALFKSPFGICTDKAGNIFVTDIAAYNIRKITSAGVVTTYAGSGIQGNTDGPGTSATFNDPYGICADTIGNLYVSEYNSCTIRKINTAGVVSTIAGTGTLGYKDGIGTAASFSLPQFMCMDPQGNLYVAERGNNTIRKITIQ